MRKIMITLHRYWWIFILVGIYTLWNLLDLLLGDVYWELYTYQEIIKDCIIRGVLFLFFVTSGAILGLRKKRYIAKYEESTRSAAIENRKDTTDKLGFLSRKINNFHYKFYILTDVIKIELSWEDYGTGNRLGWVHKPFEIRFDEKNYKYVEDICKVILQAVKDNMPYDIITDEEYSIELSSLITSFKKKYADSFPFLNKDGLTIIKTLKNTIKKSDSPNAFDWECDTELVELACDRNDNFYIVITVENTTAENNGRPSTRRNVKKFDTNITFTNFSDVTYVNYIDYITCEFITSLYSKEATPYDSKDIKLYKKYDEDIYFVRLYGTVYNTGGTLYFDLEKDYFVNHSIEDFCDFIQEKCIWNEDYFSDYREVIKQNHTVLQLFKKDNVSYTEEIPKLYHWTSSSKSEMLLIEIYCDTGGGEGVVIDSSSNTPYHKWWDMGNMWGKRSLEMTWEQVENVDPIKFKGINEHNWKKYIK